MNTSQSERQILLIGHGSQIEAATHEFNQLAEQLSNYLQMPVNTCFLEFAEPPIIDGIRACVEQGAQEIVALPLFLGPAGHQKNDVPAVINWARREWREVLFLYGIPLGVQYHMVSVLEERLSKIVDADPTLIPEETAVIVGGRGSHDPDSNGEVAKLARLLYEGRNFGWVEPAYFSLTGPSIPQMIERCAAMGAKRVIVLPYLLFTGKIYEKMVEQAHEAGIKVDILVETASYLFPHDGLIQSIAQRYAEAVTGTANMTCDLCKYRNKFTGFENEFGLPQTSDASHGLRGVSHTHGFGDGGMVDIERKLAEFLPPRYQNGNGDEVSAAPMSAADLVFDGDGQVAWNEIWEDFCDLALAGGPAHRDTLLEPVDPALVKLNPSGYKKTLAELARGITLVTGLPVIESKAPGWIGMQCASDEMAIWLLRAIVVENVFARRENNILYFPAGPHFQLQKEIKNIVTVIAKTTHYWTEHISYSRGLAL